MVTRNSKLNFIVYALFVLFQNELFIQVMNQSLISEKVRVLELFLYFLFRNFQKFSFSFSISDTWSQERKLIKEEKLYFMPNAKFYF